MGHIEKVVEESEITLHDDVRESIMEDEVKVCLDQNCCDLIKRQSESFNVDEDVAITLSLGIKKETSEGDCFRDGLLSTNLNTEIYGQQMPEALKPCKCDGSIVSCCVSDCEHFSSTAIAPRKAEKWKHGDSVRETSVTVLTDPSAKSAFHNVMAQQQVAVRRKMPSCPEFSAPTDLLQHDSLSMAHQNRPDQATASSPSTSSVGSADEQGQLCLDDCGVGIMPATVDDRIYSPSRSPNSERINVSPQGSVVKDGKVLKIDNVRLG